jgi:hypothetical protein
VPSELLWKLMILASRSSRVGAGVLADVRADAEHNVDAQTLQEHRALAVFGGLARPTGDITTHGRKPHGRTR